MSFLTTVLPVYNGEKLLKNTLESVARQTRRPDRIIVLDDVSSDKTLEVAKSFQEIPCECFRNEKNLGYFGNFNQGLAYATQTDYLHILHQDDLLKPQFYETLMNALGDTRAPAMAYCKAKNVEAGHVPPEARSVLAEGIKFHPVSISEFIADRAELKAFPFCATLIKTDKKPLQSQFRKDLALHGDMIFWADLGKECSKIIEVNAILLLNGIHQLKKAPSLKVWIKDDWQTIQIIEEKRGSQGISGWIRKQKLACKFAARCAIKRKIVSQDYPDLAKQISVQAKASVGIMRWYLGLWAAKLRRKA